MQTVNFLFSNWFSCSPSKLFIPFQRYYSVPDLNKVFTNPEDGILLLIQTCINSFWQNFTMRLISLPSENTSWQNAYICVWRTITSISSYSVLCAPNAFIWSVQPLQLYGSNTSTFTYDGLRCAFYFKENRLTVTSRLPILMKSSGKLRQSKRFVIIMITIL